MFQYVIKIIFHYHAKFHKNFCKSTKKVRNFMEIRAGLNSEELVFYLNYIGIRKSNNVELNILKIIAYI